MIDYKKIFAEDPYSLSQSNKERLLLGNFKKLTLFHYKYCKEYKKILDKVFGKIKNVKKLQDLPYIHTSIFKKFNLYSQKDEDLKTFTSSGTSNNSLSKINIDKKTSFLQARALNKIFNDFFHTGKENIFIVDSPDVLTGKNLFSARGAAINGFKQMFKKTYFLLDEKKNIKIEGLIKFINQNPNEKFVIFGFTSYIWFFLEKIIQKKIKLPKNNGIVIHGGGWKKMESQSVSRNFFNNKTKKLLNLSRIHNYYGMIEQTGSIFFECERGYFHASIFSEIFIRDKNLLSTNTYQEGLIQTMSILPNSYPGHNILTEDIGKLFGIDDCKCGRKGKYFLVSGRAPETEVRGCSDIY